MNAGKLLMLAGLGLFLAGLVMTYWPGLFSWFGRLPGDIRVEGRSGFLFIPVMSMILVSVVLTLLINLFFRK